LEGAVRPFVESIRGGHLVAARPRDTGWRVWTLPKLSLPVGPGLARDGTVSGTATQGCVFRFTVRVTDISSPASVTQSYLNPEARIPKSVCGAYAHAREIGAGWLAS